MKKIVIASDSFKGSLTSYEVAQTVEKAVREVLPRCEVISVPVADGGEGTVEALTGSTDGEIVQCRVHDPLMKIIEAEYGIMEDGTTAVIEIAAASGLTLIPAEKRNPMITTSYGTGELILNALAEGCRKFLIGIGGSATNDAGTGMLQALGFRFMDKDGKELGQGGHILQHISEVDCMEVIPAALQAEYIIACDVDNPFSGIDGAAYVFAPQKGADKPMVAELDKGLKNFASVIYSTLNIDIENIAGSGAAGGMGGAFAAFLNAELKPGVEMILEALEFDNLIKDADLIFTGEGKLDRQTAMGKTVTGVLKAAKKQNIPVVAIGGQVEDEEVLSKLGFDAILPILAEPVPMEQAMDKDFTRQNIIRTVRDYIKRTGE